MSRRILIVDSEPGVLFAMSEYFGAQGYEVDCARDWYAAKVLLATKGPVLVIADLRPMGDGGTEDIENLRFTRSRYPGTRIVALTESEAPGLERVARRWGADAVLTKPLPLPDLARVVSDLLRPKP